MLIGDNALDVDFRLIQVPWDTLGPWTRKIDELFCGQWTYNLWHWSTVHGWNQKEHIGERLRLGDQSKSNRKSLQLKTLKIQPILSHYLWSTRNETLEKTRFRAVLWCGWGLPNVFSDREITSSDRNQCELGPNPSGDSESTIREPVARGKWYCWSTWA